MTVRELVDQFVGQLQVVVDGSVRAQLQEALASLGDAPVKRGPGRPPKQATAASKPTKKSTKPYKRRVCPVPGCKDTAAPVFNMVCAKHKDVPKALIKKYREAQKNGTKLAAPAKKKPPAKSKAKKVVKATPKKLPTKKPVKAKAALKKAAPKKPAAKKAPSKPKTKKLALVKTPPPATAPAMA